MIFILGSGSLDRGCRREGGAVWAWGYQTETSQATPRWAGPYKSSKSRTRPLFRYLNTRERKEWCGSRQLKKILEHAIFSPLNHEWLGHGQAIRLGSRVVTGPVCLIVLLTRSALSLHPILCNMNGVRMPTLCPAAPTSRVSATRSCGRPVIVMMTCRGPRRKHVLAVAPGNRLDSPC